MIIVKFMSSDYKHGWSIFESVGLAVLRVLVENTLSSSIDATAMCQLVDIPDINFSSLEGT